MLYILHVGSLWPCARTSPGKKTGFCTQWRGLIMEVLFELDESSSSPSRGVLHRTSASSSSLEGK